MTSDTGTTGRGSARGTRGPATGWSLVAALTLGGAVVLAVLGLVDLSLGLAAVVAAIGWAIAFAVRTSWPDRPRSARGAIGGGAAVASVVLGLALTWGWSLAEGGVLGPIDYLAQRYGPLAAVLPVLAGIVGALRAR